MDSSLAAGLIGGLAAIGGVVVGGLVPWKVQKRAEEEGRLRDFRETVLRLLDVRERRIREFDAGDGPFTMQMAELLAGRMRMLRSIAESLAEHIPERLSAHDRVQLGVECQTDADYEAAQHHFTEAVALAKTEDPGDRAIPLRYLARIYYVPTNPGFNPSLGARTYERAIEATAGNEDPHSGKYFTGFTYQMWAESLAAIGSPDWEEKAALAHQIYTSIPVSHQNRDTYLSRLEAWVAAQTQGAGDPPPSWPPPSPAVG